MFKWLKKFFNALIAARMAQAEREIKNFEYPWTYESKVKPK